MTRRLRLYRALLRLCPLPFRQRFEAEMLADLAELIDTTRAERGRVAAMVAYVRGLLDLCRTAWAERPAATPGRRRSASRWDRAARNLRDGLRQLTAKPGYTFLVVLTLATGIGANSAIFETVYFVLLQPPAFTDPHQLVIIQETNLDRGTGGDDASPANFEDWRQRSTSFQSLAAMASTTANFTGTGEPEQLDVLEVSATFLPLLEVEPIWGRGFRPEEDRPGAEKVAMLTYSFWQRRFGGRDVGNEPLRLDGEPYQIVGVLPASLHFPNRELDVFVPIAFSAEQAQQRSAHYLTVVGRLEPSVSLESARDEMTAIASALAEQFPDTNADNGVALTPLHDHLVSGLERSLILLLAAVSVLLLLAVVNVANLLLARGSSRLREIAVRSALGATRAKIVSQLMTEALVLSAVGAAAGLLLGRWGLRLLGSLIPQHLAEDSGGFHAMTFLFALALTITVALGIGLLPALSLAKRAFTSMLRTSAAATSSAGSMARLRRSLVVCQVALALILVGLGTITVQSFLHLTQVDPGFRADNLLTMRVELTGPRYSEHRQRADFYRELEARIARLPGVVSVGSISMLPLTRSGGSVLFEIEAPNEPPDFDPIAVFRSVTPGYFRTMGISLLAGRGFEPRDGPDSPMVVAVNESLARIFFAGESALGHHLNIWGERTEIVGVVSDVQQFTFDEEPRPSIYVAGPQRSWGFFDPKEIAIRTRALPEALIESVRAEIWAADAEQPIASIRTMNTIVSGSLSDDRFRTLTLSSFAAAALLLAALGVYGVVSYLVSNSTVEIGVRMALGASAANIVRWVLARGMQPVLVGMALGVGLTALLERMLEGVLYGFEPDQPWMLAVASAVLAAVALAAVLVPALRATRIDPLTSLRTD